MKATHICLLLVVLGLALLALCTGPSPQQEAQDGAADLQDAITAAHHVHKEG